MRISDLKKALPLLIKLKQPVMIHGQHGIGKSESIEQFAKENGMEFIVRHLGQAADVGDLIGLPDVSGESTQFKAPDWLPRDPEWKGIIFLDEFNRARADIRNAMFEFWLTGKLGPNYQLPKGAYVIAAANPDTKDYQTVRFKDDASDDRSLHLKFTPTKEEFLSFLMSKEDLDKTYIDFLRVNDDYIDTPGLADFSLPVKWSRRSHERVSRLLKAAEMEGIADHIATELAEGLVGVEAVSKYKAYKVENDVKPFSVEEIMDEYPKIADKVKKYADFTSGRSDILNVSLDNILQRLKKEPIQYTDARFENFVKFIESIPKDTLQSFIRSGLVDKYNEENVSKFVNEYVLPDGTDSSLGYDAQKYEKFKE